VTGTFDNWSKSEKLERVGDGFSKDVTLSNADEKIYYKVSAIDGFSHVNPRCSNRLRPSSFQAIIPSRVTF
jgi:hypothetical protein